MVLASTPHPRRLVRALAACTLTAVALAGCGGGSSETGAGTTAAPKTPAGCTATPFDIYLGVGTKPGTTFNVTDAVAQRVPVLPGKMAFDASEMAGLASQAKVSPLGQYTIYIADHDVPRTELTGLGYGKAAPGTGTLAAVRILPAGTGGFIEGEVAAPTATPDYELRNEQAPVQAAIGSDTPTPLEFTDQVRGTVTVLQVTDKTICVDIAVTLLGGGGGRIDGIVSAPVVRSGNSFFVT
jgi:hypothetical protein